MYGFVALLGWGGGGEYELDGWIGLLLALLVFGLSVVFFLDI